MNVLELINFGSAKLKSHDIKSFKIDSEILLSNVLGKRREEILIKLDQNISRKLVLKFNDLIHRRSLKEPVAYIIKEKEFWSKKFEVNKNTLIPRPETELLIEYLVNIYKNKNIHLLDIGTGTGCILISLLSELKKSTGIGMDISSNAISIAKINAKKHNIQNRVKFLTKSFSDLFNRKFELIVSNPPYIERRNMKKLDDDIKNYEPVIALDGGNDGLDVIKKVIYKAKNILKINGKLALEIGNEQYKQVSKILIKNNFRIEHIIKDYKDNIRCIISTLNI